MRNIPNTHVRRNSLSNSKKSGTGRLQEAPNLERRAVRPTIAEIPHRVELITQAYFEVLTAAYGAERFEFLRISFENTIGNASPKGVDEKIESAITRLKQALEGYHEESVPKE